MKRWLAATALLVFLSGYVYAQEERRMGVQTNFLSLLRPSMPAANIGLMVEDGMKFYTIEMDLGFRVNNNFFITPEEIRLNGFTSGHRFGVNPDFTGGVQWYVNERKRSYQGLRANVGYFVFNHQQTVCEQSENINGVCVCQSVADYEFSTNHWRFGLHYRFGMIRYMKNNDALELSFDVGVFAFLRQHLDRVGVHEMCSSVSVRNQRGVSYLGDLFRNRMFDFDRRAQGYMRMNLVYRFKL
ncbi:MAG: hypothetical protein LAT54_03550 [Cryomorphaceae bacterium]|nr:hypothetical protein [Cryomorphaceae bacterium]